MILYGIKCSLIPKKKSIASLSTITNYLKSYGDEVTDFYDKEIPKRNSDYTCLAVISLDSALKKDGNHYLQIFLKE